MEVKFGQVLIAFKNYKISESWSGQEGCIIPKGTRLIVLNDPPPKARGVYALPLNTTNLDSKLVPNLAVMEREKEGFGVPLMLSKLEKHFIIDLNQEVYFDNKDAEIFWKTILKHH